MLLANLLAAAAAAAALARLPGAAAANPRLDYAPAVVRSEAGPLVRGAGGGLHEEEQAYRRDRRPREAAALAAFLRAAGVDFDPAAYAADAVLGVAFSGGGYRAMLGGAGGLAGLDARSGGALGGLWQAAAYVTGLSGGGWLVGSLAFENFAPVEAMLANPRLWRLETPLLVAERPGVRANARRYAEMLREIEQKKLAGFPVTVADVWGRALARQLLDTGRPRGARLWSDLRAEPWFEARAAPFPLILLNGRVPVYHRATPASPIYEVSPLELGTFDPDPRAFVDVRHLGTPLYNGRALTPGRRVTGIDNAGFVLGATSALFDQIVTGVIDAVTGSERLADGVRRLLSAAGVPELCDLAAVAPNPFLGWAGDANATGPDGRGPDGRGPDGRVAEGPPPLPPGAKGTTTAPVLYLADGGSNRQTVPLQPLLAPERAVDAIIAFDHGGASLNDTWPDGAALERTYARQFVVPGAPPFAHVPDRATFINLGLAMRPTFFGCDALNLTDLGAPAGRPPPLVVYLPNQPMSHRSNTSTFQLAYSRAETLAMVRNGFEVATQGNLTLDAEWAACVGCAVTQRARERAGDPATPQCRRCFARYCWTGALDPDAAKAAARSPQRPLKLAEAEPAAAAAAAADGDDVAEAIEDAIAALGAAAAAAEAAAEANAAPAAPPGAAKAAPPSASEFIN